uniref:Retrovirus-related Pol polyprotein from transposon TNT 1-94 n=1 Tax=Tanacetum cinerariifolium TaxID=118510 RepID=A0A6L2LCM9_TANCI|nr:retrovirus-related Pol polyprotein from transposon TNT 1-94 [Tanacetum cinerariifolium]
MHNNIMAAGFRDRPPMLAPGRYPQWRLRFLRYVNTRPNGKALRKYILSGPCKPTTVLVQAIEATDNSPAIPEHMTVETPMNMSPENKAHFLAEKEAIHLILIGIRDDIYLTVDACQTQYQNEVNELRAKKLGRNANLLALVATAQAERVPYYQSSRSHRSSAPLPKSSIPFRSHTSTRHKGKEIAKPITPPSKTAFEEDSDPEQAQRDKDMQNNLALIAKYFKKRTVNVAGTKEKVGSHVVQQSGIQCFNCKEYGHFAKECRKPKRVKDSAYHKEKMMLCKKDEQGVPLQVEQYNWLADTDKEVDEQELEAHYSYMAKIQEVPTVDLGTDSEPVEQNDQNDVESDDERVALANLIANLKLDDDENKKIQKQLKKENTTLPQELKECKQKTKSDSLKFVHELKQEMHADLKYVEEKEIDELESDKAEFLDMYDVILQEYVSNDVKCSYLQSLSDLDALAELQYLYLHKVKECERLAQKLSKQTESVSKKVKNDTVCNEKASNVFRKECEQYFKIQDLKAQLTSHTRAPQLPQTVRNTNLRVSTSTLVNHKPNVSRPQLKSNQSRDKVLPNNGQVKANKTQVEVHPSIPSVSNKIKSVTACKDSLNSRTLNANAVCATCNKCLVDSNHFACVTKMLNDVHARTKKPTVVPINCTTRPIHINSGCTKHMTRNLKLLCNFVEKFLGIVRFCNDQFAPILGYGDLVQGNVMINRVYYVEDLNHNLFSVGQFCDANLVVAFRKSTCFVRDLQGNDLLIGNRGSNLYTICHQESTSSTPLCLIDKATPTQAWLWHRRLFHLNFDYINLLSKKDIVIGLPKLKYLKDQLCSSCELM